MNLFLLKRGDGVAVEAIRIEHLSFAYSEGREILHDLSITIEEGDFICLLGQSGCGKSTLLRLLAGLEYPTSGTIQVQGAQICSASIERSVVFQDYGLFPWLTVEKNILLALRQKYPRRSVRQLRPALLAMLQRVGLEPAISKKLPRQLSGGMRQRCALARAFVMDAPILLLDEPFSALDAITRVRLQALLLELWSGDIQKKTVFFVTHDVDEAILLANRIFVLGQAPSRILYEYRFSAKAKPGREALYQDAEMIQLRNRLVNCIHRDVVQHIGPDGQC